MPEMAGYDKLRWWDGVYARSEPELELEPGPQELAIAAVLRDLAGGGPALELAVGGGRIALPLAAMGVEVDGIDFSPSAIELLRAHPGGERVNASVGDLSDFSLGRRYSLIYCVANGIANVDQDGQVRCFARVAEHLAPGGVFLVHSSYTQKWLEGLSNGQYVEARHFEVGFAFFQALRVDPLDQAIYQQNTYLTKEGTSFSGEVHRYAPLGELDLMARMAGLRRVDVWGGWTREPYTALSPMLLATYATDDSSGEA